MSLPQNSVMNTALFVDFDNIYITLSKQDYIASKEFATNPERWLEWLQRNLATNYQGLAGGERRILIRKCYLNPQSFAQFRPYFIRSAFEVIDCPPLTAQGKTSTDIHMVMDILDALNHKTWFHEYIILSSDADFTPVLLRLRSHNRYSAVLSTGYVSPAYKAACDLVIAQDIFTRDALGITYQEQEEEIEVQTPDLREASKTLLKKMARKIYESITLPSGIEASDLPALYKEFVEFRQGYHWLGFYSLRRLTEAVAAQHESLTIIEEDPWRITRTDYPEPPSVDAEGSLTETGPSNVSLDEIKKGVAEWIVTIVKSSQEPVNMASLAHGVLGNFGQYITNTNWLQAGSFKNFLAQLDLNDLDISSITPGYVYDPTKHTTPTSTTEVSQFPIDVFSAKYPQLAPLAKNINKLTDTPYLLPEHYALLFTEIAREVNERGFHLSRTSKTVRDRCVEKGAPVGRAHVNFVLIGINYGGHTIGEELPEDARKLGGAFIGNTINLCRTSQLILSYEDVEQIQAWIIGALP